MTAATMRSIQFGGASGATRIAELPVPVPGPREILVAVERCGICASDVHMTEANESHFTYAEGSAFGHEFAGVVAGVGPGIQGFAIGQRVVGFPFIGCGNCPLCSAGKEMFCPGGRGASGALADYAIAGAAGSQPLGDNVDFERGALVEPLAVGVHGVRRAGLTPDSRVLVIGAGPVGLAVAHGAITAGVGAVAVAVRSEWRAELVREMGAMPVHVDGPTGLDIMPDALAGKPDIVFECVGAPGMLMSAIDQVAIEGTVMSMGFGTARDHVLPAIASAKAVTVRFAMAYDIADFREAVRIMATDDSPFRRIVTRRIALEDAPGAIEELRTGVAQQCKVMVDLGAR